MKAALQSLGLPILTDQTFNDFRALIFEKTGIRMRDGKQILISNRLRRRLAALHLSSYEEYYSLLTSGRARQEELHNFIDAVSTNETHFYREVNHFIALGKTIVPEVLKRKSRLSIWSAGCSTGEEAYTLRIVVDQTLEAIGGYGTATATIVGTDISTAVIARARQGVYNERALRLVPLAALSRYFIKHRRGLEASLRRDTRARRFPRPQSVQGSPARRAI